MLTRDEELARLHGSPLAGPAPFDIMYLRALAPDPASVIARAKEVIEVVLAAPVGVWPTDDAWAAVLPEWFRRGHAPKHAPSVALRPEVADGFDGVWSLSNWLGWMDPDVRPWWWWDASVEPGMAVVGLAVDGWPAPLAAARWLLRAAGATCVEDE